HAGAADRAVRARAAAVDVRLVPVGGEADAVNRCALLLGAALGALAVVVVEALHALVLLVAAVAAAVVVAQARDAHLLGRAAPSRAVLVAQAPDARSLRAAVLLAAVGVAEAAHAAAIRCTAARAFGVAGGAMTRAVAVLDAPHAGALGVAPEALRALRVGDAHVRRGDHVGKGAGPG